MSLLDRIKSRLSRNKNVTQSPDRVTELTKSIAEKIESETDLRSIQRRLLARQLQFKRDAPIRAEVDAAARAVRRTRIRRPLKSAIVHDAFMSADDKLYLSLSNGQLVRTDKPHRNLTLRTLIHTRLTEDARAAGLSVRENVAPATIAA